MLEQITLWLIENAIQIYLLIPVGIFGVWRWTVWLIRKLIALRYRHQLPNAYTTTISLVIPVYNEDPVVFRQALDSWAHENPDEIIAVIDHSDTKCNEVFRDFARTFAGARMIVTKKPGKRPALVDGMLAATSEIVALVDSDTIWEAGVLPKLLVPFANPEVGGVGTRQSVLKPETLAQKLFDIHLDSRYFDEIRFLAAAGDAITCISGRTAVYRRSAVLPLLDELLNETFWGKQVISGDDKRLTHLVQAKGWKVRYQENARVFTPGATTMKSFLKQRLRWARNSWRADLRALYDGWVWREPALALHLIDRIFQPLTTLIAPIYFLIALFRLQWDLMLILLVWWMFSRGLKIWPHLRRRPNDIIILPAYILYSYYFALAKIFAFFTMNQQGWITRWDSSRLGQVRQLRMIPAYSATFGMVFILGLGMFRVDTVNQAFIQDRRFFQVEAALPSYNLSQVSDTIQRTELAERPSGAEEVGEGYTSYQIDNGDTPELLGRKYGFDPAGIQLSSEGWRKGAMIDIPLPFDDPVTYREELLADPQPAEIRYDAVNNNINISGWGAVIDIPTLYKALQQENLLAYEGNGVYQLKANLFLGRHTLLLLESPQVSWLKLQSDPGKHVTLTTNGGSVWLDGIRVSSWNNETGTVDEDYKDGRSFILVRNGRFDILNADISYLGYSLAVSEGQGGVYGLSWRIANQDHFGHELVTGTVENSTIHHNYFGFYSFGATNIILRNNEIHSNDEYGVDPHDDSNNFIVERNYVHDNGNHGIIFSKRCFNNIIRWNRSENNALHGVMLDRRSNNNSVYQNVLVGNVDGVAIWDSHDNNIYENQIVGNQRGVRLNRKSSNNNVTDNQITRSSQYGLYLYDEAHHNKFWHNNLDNNDTGVYIKSSTNFIFDNEIVGGSQGVYLMEDAHANQIVQNKLRHNKVGIYLKTNPDDFIWDNTFEENGNNLQVAPEWRTTLPGQIAVNS
ncbi:MAG: glycosyltransferase [Ardenticatenaceae bacterium]|nr:glycosyltransferase [Ardenticatenaceae bacterium]